MTAFKSGDRVRVSDDHEWAKGATGTIVSMPTIVADLMGEPDADTSRVVETAAGYKRTWWVEFDEGQMDVDGDGPYRAGEIDEDALTRMT